MKKLLLVLLFASPLHAAVKDVASSATITLNGTGVYRITGTSTISTINGLSDGDVATLLPAAAFGMNALGNIAPLTTTATAGRPITLVKINGVIYEAGPSSSGAPLNAPYVTTAADGTLSAEAVLPTCTGTDKLTFNGVTITCATDQTGGGGGAPTTATYITQTPDATLSAEQALSALSTGILRNTTGTGVLSIAAAIDFPTLNQSTTGNAATATALAADPADCAANRYAISIVASGALTCAQVSLSSGVVGTLPMANGGTDNSTAADDTALVSNGTAWQAKAIPSCSSALTSKLLYDTATNAFSCGTDQTAGGGGAPTTATYITQTPDATLSAEQALSALSTGIVKVTTATGVLSTAVAGDFPTLNQSTTGNAATATALAADPADCTAGNFATAINASGTLTCSSGVSGSIVNVGGIQTFRQTGDVTVATLTLTDLTGLSFTFVANGVYMIDLDLIATSVATTTGYGFAFNCSVAVTTVGLQFSHSLAATGTVTGGDSIASNAARGLSSGVPTAGAINFITGTGVLVAGASGGTATLRIQPEVAASVTGKANSVMRVIRVQ